MQENFIKENRSTTEIETVIFKIKIYFLASFKDTAAK